MTNLQPGEDALASTVWKTGSHTTAFFYGTLDALRVVPEAALRPTDSQLVTVDGGGATTLPGHDGQVVYNRAQQRVFTSGALTPFTLPAPLDTVHLSASGGTFAATWGPLPPLDTLELEISGSSATAGLWTVHHVELSAAYLSITGVSTMAIETDLPGFVTRWGIDFAKEYDEQATAIMHGSESTITSVAERINASSDPAARRRALPPRPIR